MRNIDDLPHQTRDGLPSSRVSPLSLAWDVYIPIAIAAAPAVTFALLRLVTRGLDKPGARVPPGVATAMGILQTFGCVLLAVVVLTRFDGNRKALRLRTDGRPPVWRRLLLVLSLGFMLVFEVCMNLAAALSGASILFVPAVPAFAAYLACILGAFAGLSQPDSKPSAVAPHARRGWE